MKIKIIKTLIYLDTAYHHSSTIPPQIYTGMIQLNLELACPIEYSISINPKKTLLHYLVCIAQIQLDLYNTQSLPFFSVYHSDATSSLYSFVPVLQDTPQIRLVRYTRIYYSNTIIKQSVIPTNVYFEFYDMQVKLMNVTTSFTSLFTTIVRLFAVQLYVVIYKRS